MRRCLVNVSRRCSRSLGTHAATTSEVPNDPDILTTQSPELNQTTHDDGASQPRTTTVNRSKKYPRLKYMPPALGVNPAFDMALNIIKDDRAATRKKMISTGHKITAVKAKPESEANSRKLRDLRVYYKQLEDLLDMNDPEIRWRFSRGDVDLSKPIYRLLAQRKWSEKPYHLLMQRVTQMSVTPDVIPIISPTVDVRMSFPGRTKGDRVGQFEVGEMLVSADSAIMPQIEVQSFDRSEKKYTVAIVDPDVPDESKDSFQSYLHYLQTDVTLSPTQHLIEAENGKVIHAYVPPHPHQGTPYHRYTVLVWEQPETHPSPKAPMAGNHAIPREKFEAQTYAQQNGLHAVGISFWRQVWDDKVSDVMQKFPDVAFDATKNYKRIKA